jgi:hypothetical protein
MRTKSRTALTVFFLYTAFLFLFVFMNSSSFSLSVPLAAERGWGEESFPACVLAPKSAKRIKPNELKDILDVNMNAVGSLFSSA